MSKYESVKKKVLETKAAIWNLGKGQRDGTVFELCAALIADSICEGATGLSPDLHWAVTRDCKVIKTFRKATKEEVVEFVRRMVSVALPLTEPCCQYVSLIVNSMHRDYPDIVDCAMAPIMDACERGGPTAISIN